MVDLIKHSVENIKAGQASTGAYVACPSMPDYSYSWFRDGTFIAYAMDLVGEHESASQFYNWSANVINARKEYVKRGVKKSLRGESLNSKDFLHTRYRLDGKEGDQQWANFQLDGFGTWLWGVEQHLQLSNYTETPDSWKSAVDLTAFYLSNLWKVPNYDCWEDHQGIHSYTLAAICQGLCASENLNSQSQYLSIAEEIRSYIFSQCIVNGHFVKYVGTDAVDSSLLGLIVPYDIVSFENPNMQKTLAKIKSDLQGDSGGLYRYAWDSYYGGGQWLLLTAWLGWVYAVNNKPLEAKSIKKWIRSQALSNGDLPEQVSKDLIEPNKLQFWVERRGPIATPLLWSHAKFLILCSFLQ